MALHRLTTAVVGVPDLDAARSFYHHFGLTETGPGRFSTRDGGEQLVLEAAAVRGLRVLGLGAEEPDDLPRLAERLTRIGADHRLTDDVLVTADPTTGVTVEVTVAPPLPRGAESAAPVNRPRHAARHDQPADAVLRGQAPVEPGHLNHLVLGSPDQEASTTFFTEGLGFEVSDGLAGVVAFMRCSEWHHNLAVQAGPVPFLHHMAFEVDDVDEVGRGAGHLLEQSPDCHVWGLGRHAIGSNYFWYLSDPAGNFVEYTADVDRITDQAAYRPKDWSGHEGLYAWGPPPPVEFLQPADLDEIVAAIGDG